LEALQSFFTSEFWNGRIAFTYEPQVFSGRKERVKRLPCAPARRSDCRERRDVRWITAYIAYGHGEMAMLRVKRMPHRICEESLWQIRHSLKTYAPFEVLMAEGITFKHARRWNISAVGWG
jgi:hypothetical protein